SNEFHPEVRYDLIRLIFVRLSKFDKNEKECKSDLDKLLFVFKNMHNLDKVPKIFNKPVFKRLFEIARISNFTEEELMDYESDMKRFSDHMNALAYAKKKGILQTAKNMLAKGYSIAEVIGVTNLPREEIRALKQA
ncbi:MAG: Rpn family recombination-promoting nuclease/putative transposase, partial [Fibromonadaceae bacterium]|nr:Rpn family recombination-promoting nuclease/putative transposase [Fibromonadaceae bacterium]